MSFKEIDWTDDVIEEFWRYWRESPDLYFSEAYGDTIIQLSKRKVGNLGLVLDFGSGSGGLLASLSRASIDCYGFEIGHGSREKLMQRFANEQNVLGITNQETLSGLREKFDTVFLIETIEHLSDHHLETTMKQIYSVLKPGGWLVISTPNKEDLEAAKVYCPVSKLVFHPMQHLRSWNKGSLYKHLKGWQYADTFCLEIDLNSLPYRSIIDWLKYLIKRTCVRSYVPPHLFAFARKPNITS